MKLTRTLVGALVLSLGVASQAAVVVTGSGWYGSIDAATGTNGNFNINGSGFNFVPGMVTGTLANVSANESSAGNATTGHNVVGNTLSGYAYSDATATVNPGVGSASSASSIYSYVTFDVTTDSNASYYSYTLGTGASAQYNRAGTYYSYDSYVSLYQFDGSDYVLVDFNQLDLGHAGAGTIGAGSWAVEVYSFSAAGAAAYSTKSGATASAQAIAEYNFTAEPVPEPASMAVLGLGLAAVARRRRNK